MHLLNFENGEESLLNVTQIDNAGITPAGVPAHMAHMAYLQEIRTSGKHSCIQRIPTIREEVAADWAAEQAAYKNEEGCGWVGPLMLPRKFLEGCMTFLEIITPSDQTEWRHLAIALIVLHIVSVLSLCCALKAH